MDRRAFFSTLLLPLAAVLVLAPTDASAARVFRHRARHRVRRRYRRHAFTRIMFGRPFWVVPVGMAVGWELMHEDRVVVVKEIRVVEKDGRRSEVAVVQDGGGKTEQIDITREDTAANAKNLEGSPIAEGDTTSPGIESEVPK